MHAIANTNTLWILNPRVSSLVIYLLCVSFNNEVMIIKRIVVSIFSYDSDNPRVHGDVGMAGVAVDSVEDMKVYSIRYDCSNKLSY